MFLVVEEGVWRDVEEVNVGDVVRGSSGLEQRSPVVRGT